MRMFVLGAADPEMAAIERLLLITGEQVVFAAVNGVRCHPGNAYKANTVVNSAGRETGLLFAARRNHDEVILVECGGNADFSTVPPVEADGEFPYHGPEVVEVPWFTTVIDHHRPGDPGYGRPPEEFLAASSVGQVFALLHMLVVPGEIVLAAAADHCLEPAYRGRCPGVDPDELMRWRAESRAAFQKRSVEDVLADVEAARKRLQEAVADRPYADLRGESIPELPEAAARDGIAFLATVKERDGREKVVLQAASPALVKEFLDGRVVPALVDTYGDPARGFAGGYTS